MNGPSMNGHPYSELRQAMEHALQSIPLTELPRLMGDLEYFRATAELRMKAAQPTTLQPVSEARYLTVAEVAERFKVTQKWLYRHKKQMPYSQPSRKVLLFPEAAVTKWFANRKGY